MWLDFNKEKVLLEVKNALCFTGLCSFSISYPCTKEKTLSGESDVMTWVPAIHPHKFRDITKQGVNQIWQFMI